MITTTTTTAEKAAAVKTQGENLALGKPASSSSFEFSGTASKAITTTTTIKMSSANIKKEFERADSHVQRRR